MTKEDKYNYWIALAQYDLDTAGAMFAAGRWFDVVFMCQQAFEKLCKGLFNLYLDDEAPRTHNIKQVFLSFKEKISVPVSEKVYLLFDALSAQWTCFNNLFY